MFHVFQIFAEAGVRNLPKILYIVSVQKSLNMVLKKYMSLWSFGGSFSSKNIEDYSVLQKIQLREF